MEERIDYGESFYKAYDLKYFAKKYLKKLPKDVDILISRGSSGNSIASAMLTLCEREIYHIHVRKNNRESGHSGSVIGIDSVCVDGEKTYIAAIVDDFIDTGKTIEEIMKKVSSQSYGVFRYTKVKYILVHHDSSSRYARYRQLGIKLIELKNRNKK